MVDMEEVEDTKVWDKIAGDDPIAWCVALLAAAVARHHSAPPTPRPAARRPRAGPPMAEGHALLPTAGFPLAPAALGLRVPRVDAIVAAASTFASDALTAGTAAC